MIRIVANIAVKCIKYLQKHNIQLLQDKEGNLIDLSSANKYIKYWQNRPIKITYKGKNAIYYEGKNYILEGES